ncbi:hypothetical protein Sru01_28650 [Sphaerisporangium rufum]|uniref:Polysaccharide chain length determinant N-terminal domain-containing protein n=1 Tax=Sphaerisporangium rufum TaxID=1381558 RepID=A0A919R212_9ACTN|nr:hypothetical protein [Sphaerisporangium rufum]GII77883.1 hypothetical protein Sru01_28650 [Sphaerisporangium rufum]
MSHPASSFSVPRPGRGVIGLGAALRRRRTVLIAFLLAGACGGGAALAVTPPSYAATAEVLVLATGVPDQAGPATGRREPPDLGTEARLARSAAVAARAARTLKAADPAALRDRVTVAVPSGSAVLALSFTAGDPANAAAGAAAFAQAYLDDRAATAAATLDLQAKALSARLRQTEAALSGAATRLARLAPGSAGHAVAADRQRVLARQLDALTARYDALTTVAVTPGTVISDARPPAAPAGPGPPLYLAGGVFAGLLAGIGAALARDRLDTRLRDPADVERRTGLTVLCEGDGPHELRELAISVSRRLRDGGELLVRAVTPGADPEPLADELRTAMAGLAPIWVRTDHAAGADAALLLIAGGDTRTWHLAGAVHRLRRTGTPVLGVVMSPGGEPPPRPGRRHPAGPAAHAS